MKTVDLNKRIEASIKSLTSARGDISEVAKLAIVHAMPRRYGEESHGDIRPLTKLISGLIENQAQAWAHAVLWYIKDCYPIFKVVTDLKKWSISLVENHKELAVEAMVKPHDAVSPASYERVISAEKKAKDIEAAAKSKATRAAKVAEVKAQAGEIERLRAENKALREKIDTLKAQADKGKDVKSIELLGKTQTDLETARADLKASKADLKAEKAEKAKFESQVKGLDTVVKNHVATIATLTAELAAYRRMTAQSEATAQAI